MSKQDLATSLTASLRRYRKFVEEEEMSSDAEDWD